MARRKKRLTKLDIFAVALVNSPASGLEMTFSKQNNDPDCAPGFRCINGPAPVAKSKVAEVLSPAEYGKLVAGDMEASNGLANAVDFDRGEIADSIAEVAAGEGRIFTHDQSYVAADSFISEAFGDDTEDFSADAEDLVAEVVAELAVA